MTDEEIDEAFYAFGGIAILLDELKVIESHKSN